MCFATCLTNLSNPPTSPQVVRVGPFRSSVSPESPESQSLQKIICSESQILMVSYLLRVPESHILMVSYMLRVSDSPHSPHGLRDQSLWRFRILRVFKGGGFGIQSTDSVAKPDLAMERKAHF